MLIEAHLVKLVKLLELAKLENKVKKLSGENTELVNWWAFFD